LTKEQRQDQISAVNPRLYARRFKEFISARVKQPESQAPSEMVGLPPRPIEGALHLPAPPMLASMVAHIR